MCIEYKVIRKRDLKHTYIQIKHDATIEVKTNFTTSEKLILNFIIKKSDWIGKKQALIQKRGSLLPTHFHLFGKVYEKADYSLTTQKEIDSFYHQKTVEVIQPLIESWSQKMQLFPTYVGYRKNKSRWGSCNGNNRLSFNTNLAKMHHDFIEYVVVHELAHIKHKNHSKNFWQHVEKFLPNYKNRKKLII